MNVPPSRIQLRTGSTIGSPRFCAEFYSHRNSVCICSVNVVALWRASRTPTRHRPVELERAPFAQGQIQTALPSAPIAESAPAPVVPAADVHRGPPAAFAPPLPAPASLNALPQVPQPAPFPIPSPASSRPDHTRTSRFRSLRLRLENSRLGRFLLGRFARSSPAPNAEQNPRVQPRRRIWNHTSTKTVITAGDGPVHHGSGILVTEEIRIDTCPCD